MTLILISQSLLQQQTAGVDSGVSDDNVYGDVGATSNGNGKSTSTSGASSKRGSSNSRGGGTGVSTSGTSTSGTHLKVLSVLQSIFSIAMLVIVPDVACMQLHCMY
jgi:hypothetical protein